jgi:hypothetical protein
MMPGEGLGVYKKFRGIHTQEAAMSVVFQLLAAFTPTFECWTGRASCYLLRAPSFLQPLYTVFFSTLLRYYVYLWDSRPERENQCSNSPPALHAATNKPIVFGPVSNGLSGSSLGTTFAPSEG